MCRSTPRHMRKGKRTMQSQNTVCAGRARRLSTGRALASLGALVVLVAAQLLALGAGELLVSAGLPPAAGNVLAGVLYAALGFGGTALLCTKGLGLSLEACGLGRPFVRPVWAAAAFLMPALVCAVLLCLPGRWVQGAAEQQAAVWCAAVAFFGFGTGIVEEAVFRGAVMHALEYRWGRLVAVLLPSVLFSAVHIIGAQLSLGSMLQLLAAGTMVGVLFSLTAYESGSIWPGAWMHGIWNIVMVGGVLNIGPQPQDGALFNYVLDTRSFLLTGGDFGVEASVPALAAYLLFAALALGLMRRRMP